MATTAERRLLVGCSGALAALAAWLLMGVPAAPWAPTASTATGDDPLASEAPRQQQQQVAALVAACKTATSGDAARLRKLALSGDPLVAGNAIRALARLQAVHTDAELLRRLDDPAPRVRHELIAALGQSGDAAMASRLEPLLYSDDPQARCLAIQALVQLHATAPLQRLLQDPGTDAATRAFAGAATAPLGVPSLLATTASLPR